MSARPYHVLFICATNTARSIIAESILNFWGADRFIGYSAGTEPGHQIDPMLLEMLTARGMETAHLVPKDWKNYVQAAAPRFDFIVTLCDQAAGEPCPTWPGRPVTAHWAMPDPDDVADSPNLKRFAYLETVRTMEARIRAFLRLKIETLDALSLQHGLDAIAREGVLVQPA